MKCAEHEFVKLELVTFSVEICEHWYLVGEALELHPRLFGVVENVVFVVQGT